jgi:transcriptional regulator with XRE-family HTH domain
MGSWPPSRRARYGEQVDIYAEIGKRVAALRRERGLTQEQIAERAGIGDAYVAKIEQGKKRPSVEVLEAIAKGLRVPL